MHSKNQTVFSFVMSHTGRLRLLQTNAKALRFIRNTRLLNTIILAHYSQI